MQKSEFKFALKSLDDKGKFQGLASVYNNIDLGGDVVVPGAFAKTLQDRAGEVPILFAHNSQAPIGLGKLTDGPQGLQIEGQLVLAVAKATEAYELLKARVLRGLSIGYDSVKSDFKDGVRYLREVKLFEVSLVVMPMNELATVTAVKDVADLEPAIRRFQELLAECKQGF
jgi:HK97 family phage prohead protease